MIDTASSDSLVCPHCGHKDNDVNFLEIDDFDMTDGVFHCYWCDEPFSFTCRRAVVYETKPLTEKEFSEFKERE